MSEHKIEYVSSGVPHPYHLIRPSAWPLTGAISALLLTGGAVIKMHQGTGLMLMLGLVGVLTTMFLWWRDVIRESVIEKAHSPVVSVGLRYGMALFIASEVMFFVAFFWAFFNASLFPLPQTAEVIGDGSLLHVFKDIFSGTTQATALGVWPPKGVEPVNPFHLPFLMTAVLLLSGVTVTWAHHALIEGNKKDAEQALAITILLGIFFTCIQAYEYAHSGIGFNAEMIFSSTFLMATGFHGFHVLIGTIFLIVCWFRLVRGDFTPENHFGFEAAAWYWHFVDVVWLFLFTAIYWWGAANYVAP